MADGAVRTPPYRVGLALVAWVRSPGIWHELDGECLRRGVDLRCLTYDRFLNVVYQSMIARLEYDDDRPERPRRELDLILEVDTWRIPGTRPRESRRHVQGQPYWWRGDEDASQSFLAAMGVVT